MVVAVLTYVIYMRWMIVIPDDDLILPVLVATLATAMKKFNLFTKLTM
jgi:hypothetical protein